MLWRIIAPLCYDLLVVLAGSALMKDLNNFEFNTANSFDTHLLMLIEGTKINLLQAPVNWWPWLHHYSYFIKNFLSKTSSKTSKVSKGLNDLIREAQIMLVTLTWYSIADLLYLCLNCYWLALQRSLILVSCSIQSQNSYFVMQWH